MRSLFVLLHLLVLPLCLTAQDKLRHADSLKNLGQLEEAIKVYEQLIVEDKTKSVYWAEKAWCEINLGRFTESKKSLQKALEINPLCDRCYTGLAVAETNLGNHEQALGYAEKAIGLNPMESFSYYIRGQLYELRNEKFRALMDFDQAIALDTTKAEYYYARGLLNSRDSKHALAVSDFSQAIRLQDNIPLFYYERSRSYFGLGRYGAAHLDAEMACALDSLNSAYYVAKGAIEEVVGEDSMALITYTKAIEADESNYIAWMNRGSLYYGLEEMDRSCSDYQAAYFYLTKSSSIQENHLPEIEAMMRNHCDSASASFYYQRGIAAINKLKQKDAIAWYEQGLKIFPGHPLLYSYLGNAHLAAGSWEEAGKAYDAALKSADNVPAELKHNYMLRKSNTDPDVFMRANYATLYLNRAKVRLMQNDLRAALDDADRSIFLAEKITAYPYTGNHIIFRSVVLSLSGRHNEAVESLRTLLHSDTSSPLIHVAIGRVLMIKALGTGKKKAEWGYGFTQPSGIFYLTLPVQATKLKKNEDILNEALLHARQAAEAKKDIGDAWLLIAQIEYLLGGKYCEYALELDDTWAREVWHQSGLPCP